MEQGSLAFTAVYLKAKHGYIGFIEELPGVNSHGSTIEEARETLRAMTRGGVLPGEDAVARIEKDFPKTTAGALARIVHARIKLNAKDFAGAAALLDSSAIRDYTVISDYALSMRAEAFDQANRRAEARVGRQALGAFQDQRSGAGGDLRQGYRGGPSRGFFEDAR